MPKKINDLSVTVIPCLFSCFAFPNVKSNDLTKNSIVVTYPQSIEYHGSIWMHPASSPLINVNNTSKTHLTNLLEGTDAATAAGNIIDRKRKFESMEELNEYLKKIKLVACIRQEERERIVFA